MGQTAGGPGACWTNPGKQAEEETAATGHQCCGRKQTAQGRADTSVSRCIIFANHALFFSFF